MAKWPRLGSNCDHPASAIQRAGLTGRAADHAPCKRAGSPAPAAGIAFPPHPEAQHHQDLSWQERKTAGDPRRLCRSAGVRTQLPRTTQAGRLGGAAAAARLGRPLSGARGVAGGPCPWCCPALRGAWLRPRTPARVATHGVFPDTGMQKCHLTVLSSCAER